MITEEDPRAADVQALLATHLGFARDQTPPEDAHALDLDGLLDPSVTFFTARRDGRLVAMGALRELDPTHGEVKSMHTAEAARGRGLGRAMIEHLLTVARTRGYRRLSLETGTMAAFAPSRALYERAGFVRCPPFAGYPDSPNSAYYVIELGRAG